MTAPRDPTPAMLAAGANVVSEFLRGASCTKAELALKVWNAMHAARDNPAAVTSAMPGHVVVTAEPQGRI